MKTSLDHLSESKQKELSRIVSIIRDNCDDVEMVILFGSYARGDYKVKDDLNSDRKSGHVSDYDILVVTKQKKTVDKTSLWDDLANKCNNIKLSAHTRLIVHDIQELNIKLAEGQYFFSDIKKEGYVLYDSGNFKLASERKLTPKERKRIAQDHFDHWRQRAERFYENYRDNLAKEWNNEAAFMLHQSVEASYKSILLVYTNYNPNEHYLKILGNMVTKEDSVFINIFPTETEEEIDRFDLLDYAYIGARYDPKYRISKDNLKALEKSVKNLLELTEKACKQRIKNLI